MSQEIIIDGYNLIASAINIFPEQDFRSRNNREHLLQLLEAYSNIRDVSISVVFDNKTNLSSIHGDRTNRRKVSIHYSSIDSNADEVIVSLAKGYTNSQSVIVVTSDKRHIGQLIAGYGFTIKSSTEFMKVLMKAATLRNTFNMRKGA